jgi:lipopolysaccharide transport system ATP-binding protein
VFQEQCFGRVAELRRRGTTIVFISHDLSAVERLCRRALLLRDGRIVADGAASEIAARYRRWAAGQMEAHQPPGRAQEKPARIVDVRMRSTSGAPEAICRTGYPLTTAISLSVVGPVPAAQVEVNYLSHGGNVLMCAQTTTLDGGVNLDPRIAEVEFTFDEVGLQPGTYSVVATLAGSDGRPIDRYASPIRLTVESGRNVRGYFYSGHRWRVHACAAEEAAR